MSKERECPVLQHRAFKKTENRYYIMKEHNTELNECQVDSAPADLGIIPNVSTQEFLNLFGGESQHFRLVYPDKKANKPPKIFHLENFSDVRSELKRLNGLGYGVFFGVNEFNAEGQSTGNVIRVRAVFADLDGAPLLPILDTGFEPHVIVESSPGKYHVYWVVEDVELEAFTPIQKAISERFNSDKTVNDLPRVMRLPGFYHTKAEPFLTTVKQFNPQLPPYTKQQVIEGLGLEVNPTTSPNLGTWHAREYIEGGRNHSLSDRAYALKKLGVSDELALRILITYNKLFCQPPLELSEVRKICKGKEKIEPDEKTLKDIDRQYKIFACISEWDFFLDQDDELYASIRINQHPENIPVGSTMFRGLLQSEYSRLFNKLLPKDAVDQVAGVIHGCLLKDPRKRTLYRRVARVGSSILIDRGTDDWSVYEITGDGWRVIHLEDNIFVREHHYRPYSCDENTIRAMWDNIFGVLGIEDTQIQGQIKIWLGVCLIPDIARPGVTINGPHGSGKTTLATFLRQAVDPVESPLERFPANDERTLELKLFKNHIPAFDNLNGISQKESDILCQTITGCLFDNRKLYSDSDTVPRYIWKPWILNGITLPGTASDFLSRVFLLELEPISAENRRGEKRIRGQLEKYLPQVQALVFDCLSAGLNNIEHVRTNGLQRLADAQTYSLAMAEVLNMTEHEIDCVWNLNKESQDAESAAGDIICDLIPEFLQIKGEWSGSCKSLHKEMYEEFDVAHQPYVKAFPKTPSNLSGRINKHIEALRAKGVAIEKSRTSKAKNIILKFIPVDDAVPQRDDTLKESVTRKVSESEFYYDSAVNDGKVLKVIKFRKREDVPWMLVAEPPQIVKRIFGSKVSAQPS